MNNEQQLTILQNELKQHINTQLNALRSELLDTIDATLHNASHTDSTPIYQQSFSYSRSGTDRLTRNITNDIARDLTRTGTVNLERLGNKILRNAGHALGEYASTQVFSGSSNYQMQLSSSQTSNIFSTLFN